MAHFPSVLTPVETAEGIERIKTHFDEHGYGLWAVEVDGRLAGFTGLKWTDVLGGHDLEVGWRLARWAWGHGYATEAAQAALEVGFAHVEQIVSVTALTNERSWRVMSGSACTVTASSTTRASSRAAPCGGTWCTGR